MPKAPSQSFQDFRDELIRRFFNPRSYFFLCLSTQLQDVDHIAADISEDDYLLIGQIMQRLVDSPQPEKELSALKILTRFQDFHHTLDESLHHLYQPGLSPDEMKQIIEGIAHDFVEVLIDVLHDPVEKKRLLGLMRMEQTFVEPEPLPDEKIMELNESVVEGFEDAPELNEDQLALDGLAEENPSANAPSDSSDGPPEDEAVIIEEKSPIAADQGTPQAADQWVLDAFEDQNGNDESAPGTTTEEKPAAEAAPEETPASHDFELSPWSLPDPPPSETAEDAHSDPPEATETASEVGVEGRASELPDAFPAANLAEDLLKVPDAADRAEKPTTDHRQPAEVEEKNRIADMSLAEPEGLANWFEREIQTVLDEVRHTSELCVPGRFPQKALKALRRSFLDIRESAMIHGYQEVEDMARKGQTLIDRLRRERKPLTQALSRLLQDFPVHIKAALQMQHDPRQEARVRSYIQALNQALLTPYAFEYDQTTEASVDLDRIAEQQQPTPAEDQTEHAIPGDRSSGEPSPEQERASQEQTDAQKGEEPENPFEPESHWADPFEEVQSSGEPREQAQSPEHSDPLQPESATLPEPELDAASAISDFDNKEAGGGNSDDEALEPPDSDLPLPGEDDPELIQLIREVAGHRATADRPEPQSDAVEPESSLQFYLQKLANFTETPEDVHTDSAVQEYRREAKLYFRVAAEAIGQLENNPHDRLAWENLELTCYSLKGLAQKLGLDFLARLPGYIEELASLVLQHAYSIKPGILETVAKGLTFLSEAADKQDIEAPHFQEVEKEILRCMTEMQKNSGGLPEDVSGSATIAEPDAPVEPRGAQLKLRGKSHSPSVRHADSSKEPLANSIGDLDFLMNDDSDLLGLDD